MASNWFTARPAFKDAHTIVVSGPGRKPRTLRGDYILISTGSKPHRPSEIAFDDIHTFDSDTFLSDGSYSQEPGGHRRRL